MQFDQFKGGGKIISTESLNTLSKREGIIFSSTLDDVYRQGLVLISISHGSKLSSIIKSSPNSSKAGMLGLHFPIRE